MSDSEYCPDKLSQYKIGGPSKPFIDKNLQLQLPEWDLQPPAQASRSHSPIYSHYVGSSPSFYLSSQVNEGELYQMMAEADRSYEAWKYMQQRLMEAATRC